MTKKTYTSMTNIKSTKSHVRSTRSTAESDTMVVLGKFTVPRTTYRMVEHAFAEILPDLLPDAIYTPTDLVGEPLWGDLTGMGQRQVIACLKHMTTQPRTQLVDFPYSGSVTRFQIAAHPAA